MKKAALALAVTAVATLSSGQVMAHETGYWVDSEGRPVKDGNGNCVRTQYWTEAHASKECDANLAKRQVPAAPAPVVKKPEPKPAPAPVAKKPEPKPAPAPAPVVEPEWKEISLSSGAAFATGSSTLSDGGKKELDGLAANLNKMTDLKSVTISGYTDSSGAASFNQRLSEKRANAVRDYLASKGVAADKLTAVGHGENNPIADNATAAGRAQNRRVEIKVDGKVRAQQ